MGVTLQPSSNHVVQSCCCHSLRSKLPRRTPWSWHWRRQLCCRPIQGPGSEMASGLPSLSSLLHLLLPWPLLPATPTPLLLPPTPLASTITTPLTQATLVPSMLPTATLPTELTPATQPHLLLLMLLLLLLHMRPFLPPPMPATITKSKQSL